MQYNFSLSSFVKHQYVYTIPELHNLIDTTKLDFEKDLVVNYVAEYAARLARRDSRKEGAAVLFFGKLDHGKSAWQEYS